MPPALKGRSTWRTFQCCLEKKGLENLLTLLLKKWILQQSLLHSLHFNIEYFQMYINFIKMTSSSILPLNTYFEIHISGILDK